ncbi:somatomedin-B and thrombospondin type-1 domain-containing protein-like isoform X2 [Falco rusticolus]|uniref:somatomedin-B and thrombospondin type-1 domain-containing protein-like isoform X2 n=1 Tax=Falco rusticolus TaxID=120794 RepID=UPI0018869DBC|nr:somatomedin-B and thrombospondin type-1 domain-containing protein-like isoform X2 [Falco rusticolus]
MQSRGSGAGIKACGSGTQCHRAGGAAPGRGSGERGFQVTLALLLPPLSLQLCHISPPPLLPSSMPLMLSFPSIPPARPAAVGCTVGPWGPWSRCSSPCGVGSKARSRQVTVPPQHGGEPCPDLKQRRGCLGEHPTCGTAKEVAKILPDSFSRDFRDPWRRAGRLLLEEPSGYCGYFRLTQVGPLCHGRAWSRRLRRDKQVCVKCRGGTSHRRPHCIGHGLQGARTFWVAASVLGCQGSWVQEGLRQGCACPPPALIFV